ncbi:MAG: hypothetical protein WKF34_07150 [Pyrinomonadaceae bacterium]
MITIRIGSVSRKFESLRDIDEGWINQQIQGLHREKHEVCVHVTIDEGRLNLVLATPACGGAGGGGRPPSAQEQKIFDVWNDEKLNDAEIRGGHLVAFFKRIRKLID